MEEVRVVLVVEERPEHLCSLVEAGASLAEDHLKSYHHDVVDAGTDEMTGYQMNSGGEIPR
ncbi:hypothetical protein OO25_12355 [Phaeobacter sp. S60]|nr:hypothetical protein OO25_12355 [Phaeobacter sp. S60]